MVNLTHFMINCTHYAKLYPQNGERFVTTDSVTSFYPMCTTKYDEGQNITRH